MAKVIDYFENLREREDSKDWLASEIFDASSMHEARLNVWNSLILSKKYHCFYFNESNYRTEREHG